MSLHKKMNSQIFNLLVCLNLYIERQIAVFKLAVGFPNMGNISNFEQLGQLVRKEGGGGKFHNKLGGFYI